MNRRDNRRTSSDSGRQASSWPRIALAVLVALAVLLLLLRMAEFAWRRPRHPHIASGTAPTLAPGYVARSGSNPAKPGCLRT
jgi:hypothetical protein